MRFDFALVKTLLRDNRKTVLDFGCGIGWNGLMCSAAGMNVVLADFASPQLDYARHLAAVYKLPVRFWELDKKPLWDGSRFDTIFIFDTLEHTVDPVKVALQIKDLLSKGGKVYATTSFGKTENHPMHENLSPDAKRAIEIIQELTKTHFKSHVPKQAMTLASNSCLLEQNRLP
jgi:2-polyprenyl-3-methyl-5-hydroxy-6-metoxy-1,4-benzoquinol methylase